MSVTAELTRANIYEVVDQTILRINAPDAAGTATRVATQMRVTDKVGSLRWCWDYAGNTERRHASRSFCMTIDHRLASQINP